ADYPDEVFDLLSIPAYDRGAPERASGSEIGSAKQLVQPGDVLLSKIVPHIRRAWVVGRAINGRQIASSEWIVFRGQHSEPRYLRHFFLSDGFHRQFMQTVSGVGGSLLRARPKYVAKIKAPLPPLEEQRRIAATLDKVDQLDKSRLRAIQNIEALQESLFNEVSDVCSSGKKSLRQYRLADLLEIPLRNGLSPSTEGSVEFGVLTLSAITRGRFVRESMKTGVFNSMPPREKTVNREEFLICRGNGNLNLVGLGEFPDVTDESTVFPDTMIAARLRRELVNPTYFAIAWKQRSVRNQILCKSRTTNGTYKINQASLESIVVSLPSLERQAVFADRVDPLRTLARSHESQMLARLVEIQNSLIDHFLSR
ncbi:MAG: restriction endonuclease subunit S, partial [Synechococcus sp. ELA619]